MTITTSQLDDLERKARTVRDARCVSDVDDAADDLDSAMTPDVVLQLTAVVRAALALDKTWTDHNPGAYGAFDRACHALRIALRGAP